MFSRNIVMIIAGFSFTTMLINALLFGNLSVDFIFLFGNYLVIIGCLLLMLKVSHRYYNLPTKLFARKIFFMSLWVRLFSFLFLYLLFYHITGTEFDIEAIDALSYHKMGIKIAEMIRTGKFSFEHLVSISKGFDYIGYTSFLGIVYFLTDNSVIAVRILQAVIGSLSVVIVYRIGREAWNEPVGKISAIIAMAFQPLIMFDTLHLRETFMVYFFLLFLLYTFRTINYGVNARRIIGLIFAILMLTTFRTVLFTIALMTLLSYLVINSKVNIFRKSVTVIVLSFAFFIALNTIDQLEFVKQKTLGYAGVETETKGGGRSIAQYSGHGQSFASILSTPLLMVQSLSSPYPSMVKTNVYKLHNQTIQWYYIGGLMIYGYLAFFGYLGIYKLIKFRSERNSLFLIALFYNIMALVISVYIFSIRYNIVKLAIAILFIGYGLIHYNKKMKNSFIIYCVFISLVFVAWNYVKLAGRGLY